MTIVLRRMPALICLFVFFFASPAVAGSNAAQPAMPQDAAIIDPYQNWQKQQGADTSSAASPMAMTQKQERVVIIHDLFDMSVDTSTIASAFRQAGFKVDNLGYNPLSAAKESLLPAMVNDIYARMKHYSDRDDETVHFVCYALGCALMHGIIYDHRPRALGNVLMLAAPVYAKWIVEGRDVAGWGLNHPRIGTPNRLKLQEYLNNPLSYTAGALTGTQMIYPQRTDTVFDLQGKAREEHSLRLPALQTPVTLRVVPASQDGLRTDATVLQEAVYYIRHGQFAP